ncbi:unnamed protein product [Rotaria socialis]|uniref:Uncharacterized protein n=1 Tax=Rotaria socialis TaxID=392032 RepID=A0A817L9J6_9BILA|nr:unnamed protein product [Rotaria socialis]
MTASSVEAMNTIGELFDKTAIYSFPGTSGQDLDDIDLQSTIESRVQILEDCLKWSAIAPTRPNTLRPNGIQVRLICIPYFAESNSCIALNLSTLECYEI